MGWSLTPLQLHMEPKTNLPNVIPPIHNAQQAAGICACLAWWLGKSSSGSWFHIDECANVWAFRRFRYAGSKKSVLLQSIPCVGALGVCVCVGCWELSKSAGSAENLRCRRAGDLGAPWAPFVGPKGSCVRCWNRRVFVEFGAKGNMAIFEFSRLTSEQHPRFNYLLSGWHPLNPCGWLEME